MTSRNPAILMILVPRLLRKIILKSPFVLCEPQNKQNPCGMRISPLESLPHPPKTRRHYLNNI